MFKMVFQLAFGLVIVFVLMYGSVFLLKYLTENEKIKKIIAKNEKIKKVIQVSSERQRIIVKNRAKISPKHMIAIIEIDDKEIVVGLSDSSMSLLDVSLKEGQ